MGRIDLLHSEVRKHCLLSELAGAHCCDDAAVHEEV